MGGAAHTSTQGVLDSPTWRLIHALATLYDPATGSILVEGFADGLHPPTPEEDALLDRLAALNFGREAAAVPVIGPQAHAPRFPNNAELREIFRRHYFELTMNIDGLAAGMTGSGTHHWTLPDTARCAIDHPLSPGIDPDACVASIPRHLDRHGYPDIGLEVLGQVGAQKLAVGHPPVRAACATLERQGIVPTLWPCQGTSGPCGHFSAMLSNGVLSSSGLGHDSGHAGPDGFFVIEGDGRAGGLAELKASFADLMLDVASP